MGAVLPFPARRRRRRPVAEPLGSVQIRSFPNSRHSKMVAFIAREMRARPSESAAELFLIEHLEIEWKRLASFGISDEQIDRECHAFARAVWLAVLRGVRTTSEVVG